MKRMSGIIICGLNGSGKSTLGREIAKLLHYKFIDVEDYYFIKNNANYKYDDSRSKDEVITLLLEDLNKNKDFIMTSVIGDYGDEIISKYTCAIMIKVPTEISIKRVKKRSYEQFGNRMLWGGDVYEKEKHFFDMVALKSNEDIEKWVHTLNCPIIKIDGTKTIDYNIQLLMNMLSKLQV